MERFYSYLRRCVYLHFRDDQIDRVWTDGRIFQQTWSLCEKNGFLLSQWTTLYITLRGLPKTSYRIPRNEGLTSMWKNDVRTAEVLHGCMLDMNVWILFLQKRYCFSYYIASCESELFSRVFPMKSAHLLINDNQSFDVSFWVFTLIATPWLWLCGQISWQSYFGIIWKQWHTWVDRKRWIIAFFLLPSVPQNVVFFSVIVDLSRRGILDDPLL